MISLVLALAAQAPVPVLVNTYPGWELYRYGQSCALRGHFGQASVLQINDEPGAGRVTLELRDPRLVSVEGKTYPIVPVAMRAGAPDQRFEPVSARGVVDGASRGYLFSLKGDAILDGLAKAEKIRFAYADGRGVMSLGYQPIAGPIRELRQCARVTLRDSIGGLGTVRDPFNVPPGLVPSK